LRRPPGLKKPNTFLIDPESLLPEAIYVFVITGSSGSIPSFFVIHGAEILEKETAFFGKYGRDYKSKHGRGIGYKELKPYKDNWAALEASPPTEQLEMVAATG
jgi:hypothetical protein